MKPIEDKCICATGISSSYLTFVFNKMQRKYAVASYHVCMCVCMCRHTCDMIIQFSIHLFLLWQGQSTTAFRSKTHKRFQERFLIIRNRTKCANFRCNHLFRATYNTTENSSTNFSLSFRCQDADQIGERAFMLLLIVTDHCFLCTIIERYLNRRYICTRNSFIVTKRFY